VVDRGNQPARTQTRPDRIRSISGGVILLRHNTCTQYVYTQYLKNNMDDTTTGRLVRQHFTQRGTAQLRQSINNAPETMLTRDYGPFRRFHSARVNPAAFWRFINSRALGATSTAGIGTTISFLPLFFFLMKPRRRWWLAISVWKFNRARPSA